MNALLNNLSSHAECRPARVVKSNQNHTGTRARTRGGKRKSNTMSQGFRLHTPTKEENDAALKEFFAEQKRMRTEKAEATKAALPALERLCKVMCERSGQPYKIRALLYSLWNGQETSLSEVLGLDWDLRKDLCAVILAFGYESGEGLPPQLRGPEGVLDFFYKAITAALKKVGQYEWFLEAHKEKDEA